MVTEETSRLAEAVTQAEELHELAMDRWHAVTYQAIEDEGEGVVIYQRQVVVECDGHDFHERTKEQAANDRERDRGLQGLGFSVFSPNLPRSSGKLIFGAAAALEEQGSGPQATTWSTVRTLAPTFCELLNC